MARLLTFLLSVILTAGAAAAAGPWEGTWQVAWPNGSGVLVLTQDGAAVSGGYSSGHGSVKASAEGPSLAGTLAQEGSSESFRATLGAEGDSFSGQTETGSWLSGVRIAGTHVTAERLMLNLANPRSTMQSFLEASNAARAGEAEALALAVEAIDFGSQPEWATWESRPPAARDLFEAVDLATFSLTFIPEVMADARVELSLPRLDGKPPVKLELSRKDDGSWRILMPSAEALRGLSAGEQRPADAFRQLQSPRDTVRAFLEGMARWNEGGTAQAIGTIDVSGLPAVLQSNEGQLMAQYIVRILDRAGLMPLQSIPNFGSDRKPFVLFEHPKGRIVIEPVGAGADTRWKFSAATVQSLRRLYRAVDELPEAHALDDRLIPRSATFWLRDRVKAYAPALLADVPIRGRLEYWQLLTALLWLGFLIGLAAVLGRIAAWLLRRPAIASHVTHERRLGAAIGIGLAAAIGFQAIPLLGLAAVSRQYSMPVVGTIVIIVATYAVWKLLMAISSIVQTYAERTESQFDNIILSFGTGVARLVLLAAAGFSLGELWSLPTTGLLAGLGIGGLAVAFASRETLANVFGAGILLGDRPFRTGDRIIAGDVNGWVEEVGLRSTRVRTLYDSLMIVPNGKLADMTINNLGARRRRNLLTTIPVTGGSTSEKLQAFTDEILARITSDPAFVPGETEVNIATINDTGVVIDISASLHTKRGWEFRRTTHQLYLDIIRMAEAKGLYLGNGAFGNLPLALLDRLRLLSTSEHKLRHDQQNE